MLTDILEDVVRAAPGGGPRSRGGRSPARPGRRTTTRTPGSSGYTPELVVAVWVGYPDRLRPMLTEFRGEPVTGGTLPALIWREFVERVEEDESAVVRLRRPISAARRRWVVKRGGEWRLDNGYCRGARLVAYFSGAGPSTTADCKPNEVSVPLVVGMTEAARPRDARRAAARCEDRLRAGEGRQASRARRRTRIPRRGGSLGARHGHGSVVYEGAHGLLPNFVGSSVADAQREADAPRSAPREGHRAGSRGRRSSGSSPARASPSRRG